MAEELSEHFNLLARAVEAAEINLEELRNSLQWETDRQIPIWVHVARKQRLVHSAPRKKCTPQLNKVSFFSNRTAVRRPTMLMHDIRLAIVLGR